MPGVPPARYAYLGPEGTFAEAALRTLPAAAKADLQPQPSVAAALDAVRQGEADHALVPIENSIEGSVSATLDELAAGEPLMVTREVLLPVSFSLMVRPGTGLHAVRRVATHPHAHAQCRRWLATVLPEATVVPALSTADAAAALAGGDAAHDAAIAAPIAAERYRLEVLAGDIEDNPDAVTRFVLVGRPGQPPLPTGHDKTTLVAFISDDHAGALLEVLTEFAVRGRQPHPHRVQADRGAAGPLLLLDRLRGARRRRPGRRGADGAAPGLPGHPVPRLLPAGRPRAGR